MPDEFYEIKFAIIDIGWSIVSYDILSIPAEMFGDTVKGTRGYNHGLSGKPFSGSQEPLNSLYNHYLANKVY